MQKTFFKQCVANRLASKRPRLFSIYFSSSRYASDDYSPIRSTSFSVSRETALASLAAFHRSPLTTTPRTQEVGQRFLPLYLFQATALTQYRASIGKNSATMFSLLLKDLHREIDVRSVQRSSDR